jgi:hypothetical protein
MQDSDRFAGMYNEINAVTAALEELFGVAGEGEDKIKDMTNILKQRYSLEARIAELTGNEIMAREILEKQRILELSLMDESLRDLQKEVWGLEDLIVAENALTEARRRAEQSIQSLIDNLMGGSLAPVQSMEFFDRRYDQLLSDAIGAQGTAEYGDKVSALTGFIPGMLQFAQAYGGDYLGVFNAVMRDLEGLRVPSFASGSSYSDMSSLSHSGQTGGQISPQTESARESISYDGSFNFNINLSVGQYEFRSLVMETIKVDPETQKQIRRVVNG